MTIKRYNCNGRFHEAVEYNGVLYLSGQVGENGGSIATQAKDCLEGLKKTLEKYNSDMEHVLSATVYLADMRSFKEFNSVWDAWFKEGTQPVRTCVEARLAGRQYDLEITLIAAVKE